MLPCRNYVCVDLETTGFYPRYDKIIEIGAVRVENGLITEEFQSLVNPGIKLAEQTSALTGITDEMLAGAPDITAVLPEFLRFAGENVLLGHSLMSDYSFLKKAAVNQNLPFERMGIDTLALSRRYLSLLPSRNLGKLCEHFEIPHEAHRALGDARATSRLYEIFCEKFYQETEEKEFSPKPLIFKIKKEGPASRMQKERLYSLAERHKIVLNVDVERLTRNEASRLTDQILAAYGRG